MKQASPLKNAFLLLATLSSLAMPVLAALIFHLSSPVPARAGDLAWSDPAKLPPPPAGAPGFPSRDPNLDVRPGFVTPPAGYGEVPFWWWNGDKLTKERIAWELDQLKDNGISGLQVNYCHTDAGGRSYGLTFPSDPKIFSNDWWEIYGWTMQEAKKRGMAVSLSDYTLGIPGQGYWIDEILKDHPEMQGHALASLVRQAPGGKPFALEVPEGLLSLTAFPLGPERTVNGPGIDLKPHLSGRSLAWQAPAGAWQVAAVYDKPVPLSIDPLHPLTGQEVIRTFFQRFEDHNPGEAGKGLNYFFSDELNFGIGGNMWTARFADEFKKRKGYDLLPELAALFTDIGPRTPKVRLDYYDVLVALSEEAYFRPVFQWHYDRGMLYGCDHGGRGKNVTEFGDYFRTQRWMTGPGCDQPKLAHDVIKNKVASSIAHLYQRPRAWSEEFHSTGWGANTDEMTRATNENWVSGMNLITLHGLYYTTHGGWWEWAPPCFHFRMPYWPHMSEWLRAYQRLSYILSQGVHRCDVAILYPVAPLQAGTAPRGERGKGAAKNDPVNLAFSVGEGLFDQGIDFDFMDEESLARAEIKDKALNVSGEVYRVLILPSMSAIHQSTLDQALKFSRNGGYVVALGDLPEASDRIGRDDKELDAKVEQLFRKTAADVREGNTSVYSDSIIIGGCGLHITDLNEITRGYRTGGNYLDNLYGPRDFDIVAKPPARMKGIKPHVLHRKVGSRDIYFVTQVPKGTECEFRATGKVELWDFWTGQIRPLPVLPLNWVDEGLSAMDPMYKITRLRMPLSETEGQLIVFSPGEPKFEKNDSDSVTSTSTAKSSAPTTSTLALDGDWEFELKPTLDNRFGDFRLPVTEANKTIGAEARRFKVMETSKLSTEWAAPNFDDSKWPEQTYSYGPHFWKLGPLPAGSPDEGLERLLNSEGNWKTQLDHLAVAKPALRVKPYEYSLREGVAGDPGHQGYHGLKEQVSDDFIALGRPISSRTRKNDTDYVAEAGGTRYYLRATVNCSRATRARIITGPYKPAAVWLNSRRLANLNDPVELIGNGDILLLRYDAPGRGHFILRDENVTSDTTVRDPNAMKWLTLPGVLRFDTTEPLPKDLSPATNVNLWSWYRFTAPPGLKELRFAAFQIGDPIPQSIMGTQPKAKGPYHSTSVWADGKSLPVYAGPVREDGACEFRVTLDNPLEKPSVVAIHLMNQAGYRGAAAFPEPIRLECGLGKLPAGDWSKAGVLETYSGGAWYRKTVTLTPVQAKQTVTLNLGNVVSTAEVHVNGQKAGVRMFAPWTLDITPFIKPGENKIEVLVYSTLANHYATIPTKYRGELAAGLLGPVALEFK